MSSRSAIAAAGAPTAEDAADAAQTPVVAELLRITAEANAALMRGDIGRYLELIHHSADYTLMSPIGGAPTYRAEMTRERWESEGRFFRNGTFEQELVEAYASDDIVVLALIERCHVEVGGLAAQEWPLRVTLVFRREAGEWRLAHRHADPLFTRVPLERAAALARGEVS